MFFKHLPKRIKRNCMKLYIFKSIRSAVTIAALLVIVSSCNKTIPDAEPVVTTPPSGSSINKLLDDPDFSILKAAVTRAGTAIKTMLSDSSAVFTFFAPNNAAFQLSGIPNEAAVAVFRPGQLDTLL